MEICRVGIVNGLDPHTAVVLLTASIFESKWKYPFNDESSTKLNPFTNLDGLKIQVPRMIGTSDYYREAYFEQGFKVLELPFDGDRFSFLIFLPNKDKSLDTLTQVFQEKGAETMIRDLNQNLKEEESLKIGVPKILLNFQANLCQELGDFKPVKLLKDLSINHLVENYNGPDLKIKDMHLKSKLELSEKKMRFVQAQYTPVFMESCPPKPFNVDRPFVWMVVQNEGKINQDIRKYNSSTGKHEKGIKEANNISTVMLMGVVTHLDDKGEK